MPLTRPGTATRAALAVGVACLALTTVSTWAAHRADDATEQRLLEVQSRQAAAVLATTVLLIQQPLVTALTVQALTGGPGDPATFRRLMAPTVGPDKTFASVSLWRRSPDGRPTRLGAVGVQPVMRPGSPDGLAFLASAFGKDTFTVRLVSAEGRGSTAYALADPRTGFVVYAERAIPADRRSPVDRDAAFADLHYAIYVGREAAPEALATTDVDPATLPLDGRSFRTSIPFGDSRLTFVTSPRHHLGAGLGRSLPMFLFLGGLILSAAAVRASYQLVRARHRAERGTVEAGTLYGVQRELSEQLQRAVLPHVNPEIPQLEIASEYLAGTQGVDIGGDWYSIIGLGEGDDRFGFVVGDVSGHGVDAVAVMAHARFTLRAYLLDGKSPEQTLEKCSHQFDILVDGHMTTAVVGVGNWRTGEVTLANAGHPTPLRILGDRIEFVSIPTGPPLGTGPARYSSTTIQLDPGETLLAFTDGLVERRTESIDDGLARLASVVGERRHDNVGALVAHTLYGLHQDAAADDIAVLAFRWLGDPDGTGETTAWSETREMVR